MLEILIPTTRTLGGATRAIVDQLLGSGFMNIDNPETDGLEVELTISQRQVQRVGPAVAIGKVKVLDA